MASITLAELHTNHTTNRHTFARLVITLRRDPAESLLVMAVWSWLEDVGFVTLTSSISEEPTSIVDAMADEAVLCLNCLECRIPITNLGRIPLTARVANAEISLANFTSNKYTAIYCIKSIFKNVCPWLYSDVVLYALGSRADRYRNAEGAVVVGSNSHKSFGKTELVSRPLSCRIPLAGIWGWQFKQQAPKDERTVFLTFSQGFPVNEREVRHLYTSKFGFDCIESLKMGMQDPETQTLFAKMVVVSLGHMDRILNGHYLAKFNINGKHIWARKYERR